MEEQGTSAMCERRETDNMQRIRKHGTHDQVRDEKHPFEAVPPQTALAAALAEGDPIVVIVAIAGHAGLVGTEGLAAATALGDGDVAAALALPALHAAGEDMAGELGGQVVDGERSGDALVVHERGVVLGGHGAEGARAGAVGEVGRVEAAAVVVHACEHVAGRGGVRLDGRRV